MVLCVEFRSIEAKVYHDSGHGRMSCAAAGVAVDEVEKVCLIVERRGTGVPQAGWDVVHELNKLCAAFRW